MAWPLTPSSIALAEADRLIESGKETAALAALDRARKQAAHPDIYRKMAEIFQRLGMNEASATVLIEGMIRFPEDAALPAALAQCYYRNDEIEKGLALTTPLMEQPQTGADMLLIHAALLKAAGRLDQAQIFYQNLLKKNPADASPLASLAGISAEQGDAEKAEALYRRALAAAPGHTHI